MQAVFAKAQGQTLVPVDDNAARLVRSLKLGAGISVEASRMRNVRFHRKFFALLRLAFDSWEPQAADFDMMRSGAVVPVAKDFESFREHVLILAGHCDATYGADGSVRLKAKSIAFENLDDFEFEEIYKRVVDVVWERVLRHARYRSPAAADQVVMQKLATFD